MRRAIAAMGDNLIVDKVMIDASTAEEYRALLSRFDVRWVALLAPLHILEATKRGRGDRKIGLPRRQYNPVHRGMGYDLKIDTTTGTPMETPS